MKCEICGKEIGTPVWSGEFSKCCSRECFHTKYWMLIEEEKEEHFFVNGMCYSVRPEDETGFRGCGGMKYRIETDDGRQIETTNLWVQGVIPDEFKDRLPDNARFVKEFTK